MDTVTSRFLNDVKNTITVSAWEQEFPYLFESRNKNRGEHRWRNLIGSNKRTTARDLTFEEIIRIKEYLNWDFSTLLFKYDLGYNVLSRKQIDQLLKLEGLQSSVDDCMAA